MAHAELTQEELKTLVDKIGGPAVARQYLEGDVALQYLEPPTFSVWQTVKVGVYWTEECLEEAGVLFDNETYLALRRISRAEVEAELELVLVSGYDLRMSGLHYFRDVFAKAQSYGLKLCPPEVAPQLWLQHPDLLDSGEVVQIAMESISNSNGCFGSFVLGCDARDRHIYFEGESGGVNTYCSSASWVFVRGEISV